MGLSPGQLLGRLEDRPGRVVVVDCPGGAYLTMLGDEVPLDVAVVVVEPYPRAGEVARRLLAQLAARAQPPRVVLVANKIGDAADLEVVRGFLPGAEIDVVVPTDAGVVSADAEGRAPLEVAGDGGAVRAVGELVERLRLPAGRLS